jgi:signal transduction histidine kinase
VRANGSKLSSEDPIRAAERQRISRELHDSTAQLLVALQLNLGLLRKQNVSAAAEPLLDDMAHILRDIHESLKQVEMSPSNQDVGSENGQVRMARLYYTIAQNPSS